jgi:hypothetical protein
MGRPQRGSLLGKPPERLHLHNPAAEDNSCITSVLHRHSSFPMALSLFTTPLYGWAGLTVYIHFLRITAKKANLA